MLLQKIVKHGREAAILDKELLVVHDAVEKIDSRGDGRSTRRRNAVSGIVKSGSEKIAVGAPVAAEEWADLRQRFVLVAATEEKFGGTEGAGRDDYARRGFRAGNERTFFEPLEVNSVTAVASRSDAIDEMKRTHFRPVILGLWNVVQVEGISRAGRAAKIAITAMDAGALVDSLAIFPRL